MLTILLLSFLYFSEIEAESISGEKKVIAFSGHVSLQYILEHHQQLTDGPISGWIACIYASKPVCKEHNLFADVFWSDIPVPRKNLARDFELARQIKKKGPLDVFLRLDVTPGKVDWFDDAAWSIIEDKFTVTAEMAAAAGFPGICLDTEQYQYKPFAYWSHPLSTVKSFTEYQQMARLRGRQLSHSIKEIYPDIKVFVTFGNWLVAAEMEHGLAQEKTSFGLWPSFVDGLLDGSKELVIVDAYEDAYPYQTYKDFAKGRKRVRDGARLSVDPMRYSQRVQMGLGIWLAYMGKWDKENFENNYRTPDEFEHSLHYALQVTDEYVWLYGGGAQLWKNNSLPQAYRQAIDLAENPHERVYDFRRESLVSSPADKPSDRNVSARGRKDVEEDYVFGRLWSGYAPVADLPIKGWKFHEDPNDIGQKMYWFAADYNDAHWSQIEIADWWEAFDYLYTGIAWYRTIWTVPPAAAGHDKLLLAFGAVDEDCWIYIDGRLVYSFVHGGSGWQTPFEVDITEYVLPGRKHTIAVRVLDTSGPGGIWKPVKLIVPKKKQDPH